MTSENRIKLTVAKELPDTENLFSNAPLLRPAPIFPWSLRRLCFLLLLSVFFVLYVEEEIYFYCSVIIM